MNAGLQASSNKQLLRRAQWNGTAGNFSGGMAMSRPALELVDSVALAFLPVIMCVGIAGNLLVIVVFRRSRATKGHPGNVAFVAICVMDTLTLLFGITWQSLRLYTKYVSRVRRAELFTSPQYLASMTCMYLLEPWTVAAGKCSTI